MSPPKVLTNTSPSVLSKTKMGEIISRPSHLDPIRISETNPPCTRFQPAPLTLCFNYRVYTWFYEASVVIVCTRTLANTILYYSQ